MSSLADTLAEVFGFRTFRPHQEEIVRAVLAGRDVFAVMPTGGGKSLCYQLPARMMPGACVVVSPLIALMKDQVDAARANGLRAATLNSATPAPERAATARALMRGELDLLYVSPERFNTEGFVEYLQRLRISFFAIDEAHCISAWGHDFRPDYLALSRIAEHFPGVPVAAFTATATAKVSDDILALLGLRDPHLTRASFNRPNLFYQITPKEDFDRQLAAFLADRPEESGIIYRTTRKDVEATAEKLRRAGVEARAYHAGLPDEERSATQEAFRRDDIPVIVATVAFGMGIDKPNVRFVVHGDLPKNLEAYYQETGRAGRDGDPARCALFYSRADMAQLIRFAQGVEAADAREAAFTQLRAMISFAEGQGCRRAGLLAYFGETLSVPCSGCDACSGEIVCEDATVPAQKILSALARTGGRFGGGHLVDIVTGANTEKIRERRHHELPTYGVGKDRPKAFWKRLLNALVSGGFADIADPMYPTPSLTATGWDLLRGKAVFALRKQADDRAGGRADRAGRRSAKEGSGTAAVGSGDGVEYSLPLFKALQAERMACARTAGMPAFMVFSDRTLRDLARNWPSTPTEFLDAYGVGQNKLDLYGERFLAVIARYRAEHPEEQPLARS